ncbi:hypothetical protein AAW14_37070 [Streptomyces hygroscopicus]|uniref:hypothetical protein n=1 Tax=Streptomyces hygroscopicus TaxID=1912 RepID=UPI00223FE8CF|nr:hypothetical protein [Streptomyces hygroscopicus]MCW7947398.1 hypothetical protein [Streptomyces hygroscopicus]MCW7991512.1 hypothetical protein [Streptomyces platensis subsp. clarensis]
MTDVFEQWWAKLNLQFDTELADLLDLNAGLREIGLERDQAQLESGLASVLDLSGGLAAILAGNVDAPRFLPAEPPSAQQCHDPGPWREAVSVEARLAVRTSPLAHALHLSHATVRSLVRARDLAQQEEARSDYGPNHQFDTDRMMAANCTRALLVDCDAKALPAQAVLCAHDLLWVLEYVEDHGHAHYALALEGALARAQDLLRVLTSEVVGRLGLSESLLPDYETILSLLDDFIGADLRQANLTGVKLDGLWWSETSTSWPPHVDIELLKLDSVETAPGSGIYVITQRGMTNIPDSLTCA